MEWLIQLLIPIGVAIKAIIAFVDPISIIKLFFFVSKEYDLPEVMTLEDEDEF